MISLNQLRFLKHFFVFTLIVGFVSCKCEFDEPTLENLRICDMDRDDLDGFECSSDLATLATDAPFITASVETFQTNPTDRIVFRLTDVATGTLLSELSSTISQLASEAGEAECLVKAAASIPRPVDRLWPALDYNVEVILENGGVPLTINKRFTIR